MRFERAERSWTGDLLIAVTEDLKTMPPFEIHVKRFKSKEVRILKKRRCIFYFHAGRAHYRKMDSRFPSPCTQLEATSGKNCKKNFQKKEKPENQVWIMKLDKISGEVWENICVVLSVTFFHFVFFD